MEPGWSSNRGDGTGAFPKRDMTRNGRRSGTRGSRGSLGQWEYMKYVQPLRILAPGSSMGPEGDPLRRQTGQGRGLEPGGPVAAIRADDWLIGGNLR